MSKILYSMIDCRYPVPGPTQHHITRVFALEKGYQVGFYGAEDPEFRQDSPYLRGKISSLCDKYDGVIFFSLFQLSGDISDLVITLLDNSLVVLFSVQRLAFFDANDFKENLILFKASLRSLENRDLMKNTTDAVRAAPQPCGL